MKFIKIGALPLERTQPSPWPAIKGGSCRPCVAGVGRCFSVSLGMEAGQTDTGQAPPLQVAGGDKGVGPPDTAQVDHCAVVGHLH